MNRRKVQAAVFEAPASLALKLDRELSRASDYQNIILSPSCLQMAMAMVLLASGGRTSQQIAELLSSYDGTVRGSDILKYGNEVHGLLRLIFQTNDVKRSRNPPLQTQHSSGIFIQSGYRVQERYRDNSKYFYNSDVIVTDFARDSRATQERINSWVRDKTRNKIRKVLNSPADPSTKCMIFSTLYFKGEWENQFTELTKSKPFTTQDGETVDVTMLYATASYPFYADRRGFQMIGLPYKEKEVLMYVILPSKGGFENLKNSLTPRLLDILIGKMEHQEVAVTIPKMKLTRSSSLKEPFEAMGLTDIFNRVLANLSGLLDRETIAGPLPNRFKTENLRSLPRRREQIGSKLYVSDIIHAVEISVDKVGTEAGAATVVSFVNKIDFSQREFHVNRPFVFFIRNEKTKSILFWGSIVDPR